MGIENPVCHSNVVSREFHVGSLVTEEGISGALFHVGFTCHLVPFSIEKSYGKRMLPQRQKQKNALHASSRNQFVCPTCGKVPARVLTDQFSLNALSAQGRVLWGIEGTQAVVRLVRRVEAYGWHQKRAPRTSTSVWILRFICPLKNVRGRYVSQYQAPKASGSP